MKVLQLCSKVPSPPKDGGCMAMINLAETLYTTGAEVKMLCMETKKHPLIPEAYSPTFISKFKPESIFIDTDITVSKALKNLIFSNRSFHLARFESNTFGQKLIALLQNYQPDVVLLDSLFTCGYISLIKDNSVAKIIYRAHNIEHLIWEEIAKKSSSFFKHKYLSIQSNRLKNEEMKMIASCDGIIAITERDKQFYENNFRDKKIMTFPFTVDLMQYPSINSYDEKALFFIGAMDWYPNLEGVQWFINEVWNSILAKHPDAKFYIAGKAMPLALQKLSEKNIINVGEIEDAKFFMSKYPMMIAPIFSGGGLKIKIVEAMALGKTVICNTTAANGIEAKNGEHILFAETTEAFVDLIDRCFNKQIDMKSIGVNARKLIESHFGISSKAKSLDIFLHSIL